MEEPQPDPGAPGGGHQVQFGPVERPVGGQVAAVLVGIGVSEHDLLGVTAGRHHGAIDGDRQCGLQDRRAVLQVVDRLEERHDAHRGVGLIPGQVKQTGLLQQQRRLEQVRHRLAHRNDVSGNRLGTYRAHRVGGGGDDIEFLAGQIRQVGVVADQWPPGGQLRYQHLHPLRFGQRRIVRMHPGPGQQFGDHLLVHLGILPHVQAAQVEPEGLQRTP